ncbi:Ditrans polycis-undecaprenyl-diphosphate synthase [termite gut metagenome]|uniref:Ditrans polycis-undecaprenyl-diphosphate synthase n=1 Tax=termite gut metagenome TaxID=433724 RepID=A0A5J4QG92_9ZZZZ
MSSYREQIDTTRIPNHVTIIMDGNGRWAKQRGKERNYGHQAGVKSVRAITEEASRVGVKFLTLYTFSTENWNRPQMEVEALMDLFIKSMEEELFMKNNIRFQTIGDINKMPLNVQECISHCVERTSKNTRMCLVLALSYSSRWEITETMRQIAVEVQSGKLSPEGINDEVISSHLNTNFMPDPDLLIRTGGDVRLSNYLLWQSAYTELYFCDTFWPDFHEEDFLKAICNYQQRERRFGKTGEQL